MKKIPTLLDLYEAIKPYTIYCDMDGVLCDFDKRFMEFSNGIPPSRYESEFGKKAFWKLISGQGVKFWVDISCELKVQDCSKMCLRI